MLLGAKYLGPVGLGVTAPQLFRADDNQVYVVKLQNNRLGVKVLVNEWLGAQLGQVLKLCFPPSDIIRLEEKIIRGNKLLRAAAVPAGLHFASRYIRKNRYVNRSNIKRALNTADMAGVILFDHMFHNFDRTWNRKNLLVCHDEAGYQLYAIDNSHLFSKGKWRSATLTELSDKITVNKHRAYGVLLKYYLRREHFSKYVALIQAIRPEEWQQMVDGIPQEWLPLPEERASLLQFLYRRQELVEKIADSICALIPDVHRGAHPH
ncbi:HipA family kinase [Propionispora hippei]|uniref:HipA-like kinase domain-containing protein n=1 Tax=Propionispora hippei DSM 15287 TaxID=1123003 RepID=A0A1M6BN55_9FIRM|nr:HipA family kinase [Propionispora hippei]SHI49963.1 hypothetical protein SAMN02745170_00456 [Propionispora hippei DSM 15287]